MGRSSTFLWVLFLALGVTIWLRPDLVQDIVGLLRAFQAWLARGFEGATFWIGILPLHFPA